MSLVTQIAWLKSAWIDARAVIEFFIDTKTDKVRLALFVDDWSLGRPLRPRLRAHRDVISKHLAHMFIEPRVPGGFDVSMPNDIVEASEAMLNEMERRPEYSHWVPLVRGPIFRARQLLDEPDRFFRIEDLVGHEVVRNIEMSARRLNQLTAALQAVDASRAPAGIDLGKLAPGIIWAAEAGMQGSVELTDRIIDGSSHLVVSDFTDGLDGIPGSMAVAIARTLGDDDVPLALFSEEAVMAEPPSDP